MGGAASSSTVNAANPGIGSIRPPEEADMNESRREPVSVRSLGTTKRFSAPWHSPGNTVSYHFTDNPDNSVRHKKSVGGHSDKLGEGVSVLLEGLEQLERLTCGTGNIMEDVDKEYFSNSGEMDDFTKTKS